MKKILVTGGAGFIGSEFVRVTCEKYKLIIVDSLSYAGDLSRLNSVKGLFNFYNITICDKIELEKVFLKEKPDYVVHWAAETHVDRSILKPIQFIKTNVEGTQNLLDLSKKYLIKKFINITTDEVYGDLGVKGEFFETTKLNL